MGLTQVEATTRKRLHGRNRVNHLILFRYAVFMTEAVGQATARFIARMLSIRPSRSQIFEYLDKSYRVTFYIGACLSLPLCYSS